ncbi:MAG: DUF2252 domain-containing protein [Atopobiaceae bacterium]|nr:DUF2252 domain-containing protein [Atopobiaceae bacterium]
MGLRKKLIEGIDLGEARSKEAGEEQGKAQREQVPYKVHGQWTPDPNRPDPVELLREQGKTRVKVLLPLRYERMSASAFAFYRGGALIMASDLANTPTTGINVQACGDAHISNFGLFLSPERRTVFDINDFDETLPGPWEWDIKRLAASVEICGLDNGFSKKDRKEAVLECVRGYREGMAAFAEMGNMEVWFEHLDIDTLGNSFLEKYGLDSTRAASKVVEKSKKKDNQRAAHKLTEVYVGQLRIISEPPLIVPLRDLVTQTNTKLNTERFDEKTLKNLMGAILKKYQESLPSDRRELVREYTPVDMAHKVVGVGSVGTRAWIIVLQGADENDPLVLQVKEAQQSVLERFVGKSKYRECGHRVVSGQRAIQSTSDMLLGWLTLPGLDGRPKHYYVRQLWNGKGSIDLSRLDPKQLARLSFACGWTLAHAHARTGDRFAIAAYLGDSDKFDKAMVKFARAYAKQNELDYQRFMEAYKSGELSEQNDTANGLAQVIEQGKEQDKEELLPV